MLGTVLTPECTDYFTYQLPICIEELLPGPVQMGYIIIIVFGVE